MQNNEKQMEPRKLAVVVGASKELGHTFLEKLKAQGFECVGISLEAPQSKIAEVDYVQVDLRDYDATTKAMQKLSLEQYEKIVLVHSAGKYKFEMLGVAENDADGDGIDDEILHANVTTFKNVLKAVHEAAPKTGINFLIIDSVFNDHPVPYWQSYAKAKEQLATHARMQVAHKAYHFHGVHLKIASLKTNRPSPAHGENTLLLDPAHVVETTLPHVIEPTTIWHELRILKHSKGLAADVPKTQPFPSKSDSKMKKVEF